MIVQKAWPNRIGGDWRSEQTVWTDGEMSEGWMRWKVESRDLPTVNIERGDVRWRSDGDDGILTDVSSATLFGGVDRSIKVRDSNYLHL